MSSEATSVKLQNAFVPKSYTLEVAVDLSSWSYEAHETIVLQRHSDVAMSDVIQLHASPTMEIVSIQGATLLQRDPVAHTLHLRLDAGETKQQLSEDSAPELRFHFRHGIQEELRGFYRVRVTRDGKEHRMASTHFEPVSARRFYICHDEPAQRADYTLTVSLPESEQHYTVVSNGPLLRKEVREGRVWHTFQTIPRCPPYLTACVVGELEFIETKVNDTPLRIYTTPNKIERARYALKVSAFALDFFEQFFKCKFPLPKLDVVAVPDFPIGGMENWGCITCVESMLVDEAQSSVNALKRASELLCHEVSHNWFGNLVAINWWEGLWLKEGFASWCGNYATSAREPSWNSMTQAVAEISKAMDVDMHEHSHPVEVPIHDPADITQIFDSISYDKGMGLVCMLKAFLGPEKWGPAVAHYIDTYQFRDTKTVQLWQALEASSQMPVTETMNSFTTQMGFPWVHVSREKGVVTLRQQPCKLASTTVASSTRWTIPVILMTAADDSDNNYYYCVNNNDEFTKGDENRLTVTMRAASAEQPMQVTLPEMMAQSSWLTANPERCGFYRCRYDDALFDAWMMQYPRCAMEDRRAIIADTFTAVLSGFDDVARVVRVAQMVRTHERHMHVLDTFCASAQRFLSAFGDAAIRLAGLDRWLSFMIQLGEEQIDLVPGDDEARLHQMFLINSALLLLMEYEAHSTKNNIKAVSKESPLIAWSIAQAEQFLSGQTGYNMATLLRCLQMYMRFGPAPAADKADRLWAMLKKVDGEDELTRSVLSGLSMSTDVQVAGDVARRSMVNDGVRSQYGAVIFKELGRNASFAPGQLWDFFQTHFAEIEQQWGNGQFRVQIIVGVVGGSLSGESAAQSFESFFAQHPLPIARLAIGRATEGIRLRGWLANKWQSSMLEMLA